MKRPVGVAVAVLLSAAPAAADDAERLAMRRVRLTTEPAATQPCMQIGAVSDDSVKDLRRKIVKAGGDTALLTFGIEDMEKVYAQVFRCSAVAPLPPGVPRPPPGTSPPPPPPPPAPSATPGVPAVPPLPPPASSTPGAPVAPPR